MSDEDEGPAAEGDPEGRASLSVEGPEHDLPEVPMPVRPYVVCCAPRSGSTLLVQLLHRTGAMGVPAEYLNHRFLLRSLGARYGTLDADGRIRPSAYVEALVRHRTTANRVFGIKVLYSQMEKWLRIGVFCRMLDKSRLIWLRRRDVVGQSISLLIAQGTQRWHVAAGDPETEEAGAAPEYSAQRIRRVLGTILSEEAAWEQFFAVNKVRPLIVYYEDLVADPDATCGAICAHVGARSDGPFRLDAVATRPTRSATNEEWRARWIADMRFRGPREE